MFFFNKYLSFKETFKNDNNWNGIDSRVVQIRIKALLNHYDTIVNKILTILEIIEWKRPINYDVKLKAMNMKDE